MSKRNDFRAPGGNKARESHPQPPGRAARHAYAPWLLGVCLAGTSCMTQQELASQLGRSLSPPNARKVMACWETEFEAAGFRGEYRAEVDLTVNPDGSLGDIELKKIEAVASGAESGGPDGSGTLGSCLNRALGETNIAAAGWVPPAPIRVKGFVFSFTDASAELRAAAKAEGAPLLIGPRADRCMGLYAFSPPREAALLDADMAEARGIADRVSEVDPDAYARALQRLYDLALEVRRRLELDAGNPDLGEESHARTLERRDEAAKLARNAGESIGCEPPVDF